MISPSFCRETPLHIFYKYAMMEMANFVLRKKWYLLFYHFWRNLARGFFIFLWIPTKDGE